MSETWRQVCYSYDGSFAGFLTCADESFRHHEEPVAFCAPEEERISLYPEHPVDTDQRRASAFYRQLNEDISPDVQRLVAHGFLTCIPERECVLWQFIRMARTLGQEVTGHLADRRVAALYAAVRHLYNEAHLLKGFTRFSDCRGLLWAEISPKNRVLPLLRPHFCARFNTETFIIFDDVHHEALLYARGQWAIRPIDHIDFPPQRQPGGGLPASVEEILRHHRHRRAVQPQAADEQRPQTLLGAHDRAKGRAFGRAVGLGSPRLCL